MTDSDRLPLEEAIETLARMLSRLAGEDELKFDASVSRQNGVAVCRLVVGDRHYYEELRFGPAATRRWCEPALRDVIRRIVNGEAAKLVGGV